MPSTLFDIRELTKVYGMGEVEVHALRQVSLQLFEGQFVVLLAREKGPKRSQAWPERSSMRGRVP